MKSFILIGLCMVSASGAFGQAAVETAILTGAGAGAAASGAKGTGAAIGGVFGQLNKIAGKQGVEAGKGGGGEERPSTGVEAWTPGKAAAPKAVDASMVKVGMSRKELLSDCGEPLFRTSSTKQTVQVETLYYSTLDKDELKVELEEGAVVRVVSRREAKARAAAGK